MKDNIARKWLSERFKNQKGKLIVLTILNIISASFTAIIALVMKNLIDNAVHKSNSGIITFSIILFSLVILQLVFRFLTRFFEERIKASAEIEIKSYVFSQTIKKEYADITVYHSGEIMNRLTSDISIISENMTTIIPSFFNMITRLILACGILIWLDYRFALVFLFAGLVLFVVLRLFRGKLKNLHKSVQKSEGLTRSFMQESVENLLAIKVFSKEEDICEKSLELQKENYRLRMKRKNYSILSSTGFGAVFNIGYVLAMVWGAYNIYKGTMGYGTFAAILQLVNQIQMPFASLSGIAPKYYNTLASAERLMEICNLKEDEKANELPVVDFKSIEFKNITFAYKNDDTVLENANFTVNFGDFVAVTGISGIGKSTLLKLLLGVYNNYSGEIYFETDCGKVNCTSKTRKSFSYVPQGNLLFSGTVKDNILFINKQATAEELNKAIEISCVSDYLPELPLGLDTVIGEKGLGLSEGQVQRLAIARAVLSKSNIILLDEATSALDEATEEKVLINLKALKNKTLIIVSHKKASLQVCNKHVEIKNKKIIEV